MAAARSVPLQMCESLIQELASKRASAMSLRALFDFASSKNAMSLGSRKVAMARFLHRELPIRMAQRIDELSRLPFGLGDSSDVRWITDTYSGHVERLLATAEPQSSNDEEAFAEAVRQVLVNRVAVPRRLARATRAAELAAEERSPSQQRRRRLFFRGGKDDDVGGEYEELFRPAIDEAMDRFFVARIGLRLLVEHYLSARAGDGGEIEAFCRPGAVAREAAQAARDLCERELGAAPAVDIVGDLDDTFTYAPSHCRYVFLELLKNACRATAESAPQRMPPVQVQVVAGDEDFSIKVADLGGGCSRREAKLAWSWFHSRYPLPSDDLSESSNDPSLALTSGWGIGLPLSRAYCRYFGGDLTLMSMEGFGTDAFVYLPRLGDHDEPLS